MSVLLINTWESTRDHCLVHLSRLAQKELVQMQKESMQVHRDGPVLLGDNSASHCIEFLNFKHYKV